MAHKTFGNRWAQLALIWLMRFGMGVQFQSIAALGPYFRAERGFNHAEIGTLIGMYFLLGVAVALPAGLLGSRLGGRRATVLGMALMVAGGAAQLPGASFALIAAARLAAGVGAVVMVVQTQRIVTDWFAGREIATALAITNVAMGMSVGLSMALLPAIAGVTGWFAALHSPTVYLAAMLAAALLLLRDAPRVAGAPVPRLFSLSLREIWLMALAGSGYAGIIAGYIVFVAFAPLVLMSRGAGITEAGTLVSLVAWVSMFSVPLGGVLADRTGRKNTLIAVGALSAAAACLLFTALPPALLWILLFGSLRGGCTGAVNSLPSEVLRPESRSAGFGVFSAVQYAGVAIAPPVAGLAVDVTGNPSAAVWVAAALWVSIVFSLAAFRWFQRRWYGAASLPAAA